MHKPEVNPQIPITAPPIRERTNGDLDPRNRNARYRKPSCLALRRQTAGVIERKTLRDKRHDRRDRTQNTPIETPTRHKTNTECRDETASPRRPAPARTNACAGAKTGQTQHFVGAQFTDSQSGISSLRASAEQRRKRKPRRSPAPRFRISNSGLPPRQTQKIPPHPYGRSGICECDYFATVRAVTWGLAPSYQ